MLFSNAYISCPAGRVYGGFRVHEGRFAEVLPGLARGGHDLGGARVLPGLVDIHIHGCAGADFSDGKAEGLRTMAAYLAGEGVTSFLPTAVTLPLADLEKAARSVPEALKEGKEGLSRILGFRMEGPFLSEGKKGAQNGQYLRDPDPAAFRRIREAGEGLVRIVDLAPERPGAAAFVKEAAGSCLISCAHTEADYETAAAFFDAGARHLTHLFNGMPPLHHRKPGPIGAAAERDGVFAELICDGIHVHESAVRLSFKLFPERICLISDALRCCGMPDGAYALGGQEVSVRAGEARLLDGTLAGAAVHLMDGLRKAVAFGIPEEEAIRAASLHPACQAGAGDLVGSIEAGRYADFLVCGHDLSLREVWMEGQRIRAACL